MNDTKFGFKVKDGAGVIIANDVEIPRPFTDQTEAIETVRDLVGQGKIPFEAMNGLISKMMASGLPETYEAAIRAATGSEHVEFCSGVIDGGENRVGMPVFHLLMSVDGSSRPFTNAAEGREIVARMKQASAIKHDEAGHLTNQIEIKEAIPATIKDAVAAVTGQKGNLACGIVRIQKLPYSAWMIVGERGEMSQRFSLLTQADQQVAEMIRRGIDTTDESLQIQQLLAGAAIPATRDDLMRLALGQQPDEELRSGVIPHNDGEYCLAIKGEGLSRSFADKAAGRQLVYAGASQGLFTHDEVFGLLEAIGDLKLPEKPEEKPKDGISRITVATSLGFGIPGMEPLILVDGQRINDETVLGLLEWALPDGFVLDTLGLPHGLDSLLQALSATRNLLEK